MISVVTVSVLRRVVSKKISVQLLSFNCPSRYKAWIVISEYKYHSPYNYAAAAAKSLQSCLTLCDPRDGSPPASPVPGILQARTLEWVAISFSNAWKWKVKVKAKSESEVAQSCQTQRPHGLQPTRLLYATMYLVSKKCLWLGSYHRLCSNVLFWEDLAQDTCFSSSKWRLSSIALFGCSALFFKTIFFNKSEGFICTR